MNKTAWIIMPVIDCLEYTVAAIGDCLAQDIAPAPRVLLIDNGSSADTRRGLEALVAKSQHRVLPLWHHPPLGGAPFGALNASWNFGLEFCWGQGAEEVFVVNNDVRLAPWTYGLLRDMLHGEGGLFVSGVGVTEPQYNEYLAAGREETLADMDGRVGHGGPDFSCFVISKACHKKYPFDENFTYYGDNDYHRHMKLGGDAERIYSVNVPYLHYGSRTINRSPEIRAAYSAVFNEHQERYVRKWGGLPGEEKWERPYEGERFKRRVVERGASFVRELRDVQLPTEVTDTPDEAR